MPGGLGHGGGQAAHPVSSLVCVLQAQTQELEELNKELRQCNLQQFIQQTGATVTVLQARSEEDAQPEPSPRELPACRRNGGQHAAAGSAAGAAPRDPCPLPASPSKGVSPKAGQFCPGAEVRQRGRGFGVGKAVTHHPRGGLRGLPAPGSFFLPIETLGLLVAVLRGQILCCCFWGWGGHRKLPFAALLHAITAAKSRWLRACVSPQRLWAGGDGLQPLMTSLCLAREGLAWCLGPCPHPRRDKRRWRGALVEGGGGKWGPGHFFFGASREGDVAALQHCSSHAW